MIEIRLRGVDAKRLRGLLARLEVEGEEQVREYVRREVERILPTRSVDRSSERWLPSDGGLT